MAIVSLKVTSFLSYHRLITCYYAVYYPITASFDHWIFPSNDILPPWQHLDIDTSVSDGYVLEGIDSDAALYRDRTCRVTGSHSALKCAHIIPAEEQLWFNANCMAIQPDISDIDSLSNTITLRRDVYALWK
ncbi:uncharacterized protein F4812DRAFT_438845 [Daldinia caldariorum]|uniref:uncharacterized protein n=1 Tax=Daldinia caldariorum TaxID=326644 RepID=UPI002007CF62|nr:uncharacterized protein F4812DRAFT_438845 [Daldinia caldariorum]KAI1465465.1 hypothetical protein F4812DRAFT_438845 [Daldinia caldariorum]